MVADILDVIGLVGLGFAVGALLTRWVLFDWWREAKEHSAAAKDWAEKAMDAKRAYEHQRELSEIARDAAEEARELAAEHEKNAEVMLDRARALHTELMS